jgi:hypothetical protein
LLPNEAHCRSNTLCIARQGNEMREENFRKAPQTILCGVAFLPYFEHIGKIFREKWFVKFDNGSIMVLLIMLKKHGGHPFEDVSAEE